jgi:hypothetical protein
MKKAAALSTPVPERVKRHRAGLCGAGRRLVQIWAPDPKRDGFAAACRRQAWLLRDDAREREILDWLETAADTDGWW